MGAQVLEDVETALADNVTFLDVWRSFMNPDVVALMSSPSEIDNADGAYCDAEQWTFDNCLNVSVEDSCGRVPVPGAMIINGTYYPPQCPPPADDCMVLVSFLPDYSLHLHADL